MNLKERERYDIQNSPLHKCASKRKLSGYLGCTTSQLVKLEKDDSYRIKIEDRVYETPIGINRHVHNKLKTLLGRIRKPAYVFSGKKGVCHIDNAKYHQGSRFFLKLDISKFYPNSQREFVFRLFRYRFKMPDDLAHLIAGVATYDSHIPTGSPASQLIAFWAFKDVFDQIESIAQTYGCKFSLYVDDMTISSDRPIPPTLHVIVNGLLKSHGHHLGNKKTNYLGSTQYKKITGVIISPSGALRIPNKNRRKLIDALIRTGDLHEATEMDTARIRGMIASAQQIEPIAFAHTKERIGRLVTHKDPIGDDPVATPD